MVSAVALALTGCAELPAPAPVAKVDYRACLVTEQATDDLGINELADYAVKQAVATYGVKRTVLKSSANKFASNAKKLVKQGCDLFVVSGAGFSKSLGELATANLSVNFLYLTDRAWNFASDLENLAVYQVDMYEAGLLAGHLAASMAELQTVAVHCEQPGREIFVDGIRAGVTRFNVDNSVGVSFNIGYVATTNSSMRISLGCKNELEINTGGYAVSTRIVGFGRDLYLNPLLASQKQFVAATVIPNVRPRILDAIASDLEGDFIGGRFGSAVATFSNGGLLISDEREVAYPEQELEQLEQLALDYETTLK